MVFCRCQPFLFALKSFLWAFQVGCLFSKGLRCEGLLLSLTPRRNQSSNVAYVEKSVFFHHNTTAVCKTIQQHFISCAIFFSFYIILNLASRHARGLAESIWRIQAPKEVFS